jgi:hypothetical protein
VEKTESNFLEVRKARLFENSAYWLCRTTRAWFVWEVSRKSLYPFVIIGMVVDEVFEFMLAIRRKLKKALVGMCRR